MKSRVPEFDDGDSELEFAIAEFLTAEDRGEAFSVDDWLDRNHRFRAELVEFLNDHRETMGALVDSESTSPRSDSGDPKDLGVSVTVEDTVDFSANVQKIAKPAAASSAGMPEIDGYRIVRLLGAGGMGRVYEAVDVQGHRCAIKVLSPQWANTADAMERFKQEGAIVSSINHPRLVFVQTADDSGGQPFIAMELMSGKTLRDLIVGSGPLSISEAVSKIVDVIDGLQAAHDRGMIHRDIKPANCYLEDNGRVKIGDFGLARSVETNAELTRTGNFVGTPLYASPEQLRGESLDIRTDIYSVCATLYYLLCGKAPFEHSNAATVIARIASEDPVPLRTARPDIPRSLEKVVLRGLHRQRDKRYDNLLELRLALKPFLAGRQKIKTLGIRYAAYMADVALIGIVSGILTALLLEPDSRAFRLSFLTHLALLFPQMLYFFVGEAFLGGTLGKRLLRLQIVRISDGERAGWVQCLGRTTLFMALSGLASDVVLYAIGGNWQDSTWFACQWTSYVVLLGANLSPLIFGRQQRLLHDILSDTEVSLSPVIDRRQKFVQRVKSLDFKPKSLPCAVTTIGKYQILGELETVRKGRWLIGRDTRLARDVWILLRPSSDPPLTLARRRCGRPTRLRWLAAGEEKIGRWDAFLAPSALAIEHWRNDGKPLDWPTVQSILEQLTDEVVCARIESPGHPNFDLDAVLLDSSGRVVWLDEPASNGNHASQVGPSRNDGNELCYGFLAQVARSALDSQKTNTLPNSNARINAVVPGYAQNVLDRLSGIKKSFATLEELLGELHGVSDRPAEVTLAQRIPQIMMLLMLALMPFGAMISMFNIGNDRKLESLELEYLRLDAISQLVQSAEDWTRFCGEIAAEGRDVPASDAEVSTVVNEGKTRIRQFITNRMQYLSAMDRSVLNSLGHVTPQDVLSDQFNVNLIREPKLRVSYQFKSGAGESNVADNKVDRKLAASLQPFSERTKTSIQRNFEKLADFDSVELYDALARAKSGVYFGSMRKLSRVWMIIAAPLLIIALWAFATKGGFTHRIAGLTVLRESGKPVGRFLHTFRALLLWLPCWLILAAVIAIDLSDLQSGAISSAIRQSFLFVPILYLLLAIAMPSRGPHDLICRTVLVPK